MTLQLPELSQTPIRHRDCCLGLSTKLLDALTQVLTENSSSHPRPAIALSIGSGTGLLEALLLAHIQSDSRPNSSCFTVEGVEVHQDESRAPVNKYLSEMNINTVRGTWDLSARLQDQDVSALLFVYPRHPDLVRKYLEIVASRVESSVRVVIWLGPRGDWIEFSPCLGVLPSGKGGEGEEGGSGGDRKGNSRIWSVKKMQGEEAGLFEYEMMIIFTVDGDGQAVL